MKKTLAVVLATRNEEENLARCLASVKSIADEIIVVDEHSTDKTIEIAKKYGARVYLEPHHDIFHVTKQVALEKAASDWILQLDADEVVTPSLANEIQLVLAGQVPAVSDSKKRRLFKRHQELLEKRDGKIGTEGGELVAYFIPRKNVFLGKPLIHAGVYPDGVIRLVKRGKARFPQKSVHEQMEVDGQVSWLSGDLEHNDSPTLRRYFDRLNRYTDLHAADLKERKAPKNIFYLIYYSVFKSFWVFLSLLLCHRGFLDGLNGFLWSLFSALHYPIAYFKYWTNNYNQS
jgi:glycosyltransferase involved in cell wall biosynthesis